MCVFTTIFQGGGTRKGNGKCSCSKEYDGEECDKCASGFYESFKDASKLLCSPCHKACAGYCSGPGPKACAKCEKGYEMNTEHGCMVRMLAVLIIRLYHDTLPFQDIDECIVSKPCTKDKFCVNTEGTFKCMACDKVGTFW